VHWSPEISLGTVIQIGTIILLALGAARKFGAIEAKLNIMYSWFSSNVINQHRSKESDEKFFGGGGT
jgi:hypothetical protein